MVFLQLYLPAFLKTTTLVSNLARSWRLAYQIISVSKKTIRDFFVNGLCFVMLRYDIAMVSSLNLLILISDLKNDAML
jgi:hypothetical protein